jgi:hypothetical protein
MKLKVDLIPRLVCIAPLALAPLAGAAAPIAVADAAPSALMATTGTNDGALGEFMMLDSSGAAGPASLSDNRPAMLNVDEPATRWIASASSLLGPTALAMLGLVLALLGVRRKRRP